MGGGGGGVQLQIEPNLFPLPGLARMYERDGVVTLRESPSTFIACLKAKIRNRYNQAPHLTQDTNGINVHCTLSQD